MKSYIPLFLITALLLAAAGCSVVFTGSITGELHDRTSYEAEEAASGIGDAAVYLYTEEEPWTEDLSAWEGGSGPLPDYPEDADGNPLEPRYFLKTVTDEDGGFTFNGFIWEDFFPQYGKSGDRKEIFLLYYKDDYGLTANGTPVYIVSDVTNRLPPTLLERICNTATVNGAVEDTSSGDGVANVNVDIYVPDSWDYDSGGAMTNIVWPEEPSYSLVTGATGEYTTEIQFPREPDFTDNLETTRIRIVFERNTYIISDDIDSDIIDGDENENGNPDDTGSWDIDGDDSISDEERYYYESDIITNGRSSTMSTIEIRSTAFSGNLEGRVYEDTVDDSNALNSMTVKLFITEPTTPQDTDGDRTASTSPRLLGESTIQNGYFSIDNITWTDETHTGSQSTQDCYIYIQEDGAWPSSPASGEMALHSDTTTWIDVVVDTIP